MVPTRGSYLLDMMYITEDLEGYAEEVNSVLQPLGVFSRVLLLPQLVLYSNIGSTFFSFRLSHVGGKLLGERLRTGVDSSLDRMEREKSFGLARTY